MSYSFRFLETDLVGTITQDVPLTVIPQNTSLYETVGDERFLESGDLSFQLIDPLPFVAASGRKWVAVYWDGTLYNVYRAIQDYEKLDEKRNIYKASRLESIQSTFFNDLKTTRIHKTIPSAEDWSFNLTAAKVVIAQIRTNNELAPSYITDRWAFSIGNMLSNMVGKSDNSAYEINSLSHPLPLKNQNVLPILFRGQSKDSGESEGTAVSFTFDKMDWIEVFKIALYSYNCYLRVTPLISGGKLKIDIDMLSKKQTDTSGATPVTWLERERINRQYRIDGVRISGGNFEFTQGGGGDYVFSQSVPVSDPEAQIGGTDETLYWAAGDYVSASGKYDILDASNQNTGFYETGAIEPNYSGMITQNDGLTGQILFSGQKPLDKIQSGSDVIQLTHVQTNRFGVAKVKGIIL